MRLRREDGALIQELVRAGELLDEPVREHPPGVLTGNVGRREPRDEPEHRRLTRDGFPGRTELVGEDARRQPAQVGAPDRAQRDLGAEPAPAEPGLDLIADQREIRGGRRRDPIVEHQQELGVAQQPAPPFGFHEGPFVPRQAAGEHDRTKALTIHLPAEPRALLADHGLHRGPHAVAGTPPGRGKRPRRDSASW